MKFLTATTILLTLISGNVFAQSVYVDAISNCVGAENSPGVYKHIQVTKGVTYEISMTKNDAVFNTNDGAKMVNLGVMYVQPPRKMIIKTINPDQKTYVETEGNLYFFFIDDSALNSGGATLDVEEVNQ